MSSSTEADLVPFATVLWDGDPYNSNYTTPLFVQRSQYDSDKDWIDECEPKDVPDDLASAFGGWEFVPYTDSVKKKSPGKKQRLYPNLCRKGDMLVWYVNSSQYAAGGAVEFTAYSDNKDALQQFIDDVFPEAKEKEYYGEIEEDAIVQQTL